MTSAFDPAALASTRDHRSRLSPTCRRVQLTRHSMACFWAWGGLLMSSAPGHADAGARYATHGDDAAVAVVAQAAAMTATTVAANSAVLIQGGRLTPQIGRASCRERVETAAVGVVLA